MRSVNKTQLVGNVASNPELRTDEKTGVKIATFPLAIDRDWSCENGSKKEAVDFFSVVAFGRLADIVTMHLVKGSPVMVEGRLQNRCFDGSDGKRHFVTEIVLDSLSILVYKKSKYNGTQMSVVCVSDQSTPDEDKLAKIKNILS